MKKFKYIFYYIFVVLWALPVYCIEYLTPVIPFDIDGDGKSELIIFSNDGRMIVYNPDKTELYSISTNGSVNSIPVIFDINLDGRLEIIFITITGYLQAVDAQTGALLNGFENIRIPEYSNIAPVIADIDGDNEPEILVASNQIYAFDGIGRLKSGYPINILSDVEKPFMVFQDSVTKKNSVYIFTQDKRVLLMKNNALTNIQSLYTLSAYLNNQYLTEINGVLEMFGIHYTNFYIYSLNENNILKTIKWFDFSNVMHLDNILGINSVDDNNSNRMIYFHNSNSLQNRIKELCIPKNGDTSYFLDNEGIEFQLPPITLKKTFYNFPYIDYTGNGLLDLALAEYKTAVKFFGYNTSINDSLQITAQIDYPDREIDAITVGDINGTKRGALIFNDSANIEIIETQSDRCISPLPFVDNINSNNHYNIAPAIIYVDSPVITKGGSYKINWRQPFFFDDYQYSYSFDNINYSDFSNDTVLLLTDLTDGDYTFYLKARNQNNIEPLFTSKLKFAIDNQPPRAYFISPKNNEFVGDVWQITGYVFDEHLDSYAVYYKTSENAEYTLLYQDAANIETGAICLLNTNNINSDTIYLKIAAYEINANNYSETEIIVFKANINKTINSSEHNILSLPDMTAEIEIYPYSLTYPQTMEFRYTQLLNAQFEIKSPVVYLNFAESRFKIPALLKLKSFENQPSFAAGNINYAKKFAAGNSLKMFYTTDKINYTKFEPAFDASDNYFKLPVFAGGYYFLADDTEIVSFSAADTQSINFKISPRIIKQNENGLIEFINNAGAAVELEIYNLNGKLIDKIINGAFYNAGVNIVSYRFPKNKYETGMYIANFKNSGGKIKYIFYVK